MIADTLSLIWNVVKIGGIVLAVTFVFLLIHGYDGTRLMHPLAMSVLLLITAGVCILFWDSKELNIGYELIHAILPAVFSFFIGALLYNSGRSAISQIISIISVYAGVCLMMLILHHFFTWLIALAVTVVVSSILLYIIFRNVLHSLPEPTEYEKNEWEREREEKMRRKEERARIREEKANRKEELQDSELSLSLSELEELSHLTSILDREGQEKLEKQTKRTYHED